MGLLLFLGDSQEGVFTLETFTLLAQSLFNSFGWEFSVISSRGTKTRSSSSIHARVYFI